MNCMVFYLFGNDLLGGGDFNVSRFISDKSNGHINHRFAAIFNDWVNK
jgi:hypothetical protein